MEYTQTSIEGKQRIVAEIDPQIARLAKSLAALQNRKMNEVIETLLREWLSKSSTKDGN